MSMSESIETQLVRTYLRLHEHATHTLRLCDLLSSVSRAHAPHALRHFVHAHNPCRRDTRPLAAAFYLSAERARDLLLHGYDGTHPLQAMPITASVVPCHAFDALFRDLLDHALREHVAQHPTSYAMTLYADLLDGALARVDWQRIAHELLSESTETLARHAYEHALKTPSTASTSTPQPSTARAESAEHGDDAPLVGDAFAAAVDKILAMGDDAAAAHADLVEHAAEHGDAIEPLDDVVRERLVQLREQQMRAHEQQREHERAQSAREQTSALIAMGLWRYRVDTWRDSGDDYVRCYVWARSPEAVVRWGEQQGFVHVNAPSDAEIEMRTLDADDVIVLDR